MSNNMRTPEEKEKIVKEYLNGKSAVELTGIDKVSSDALSTTVKLASSVLSKYSLSSIVLNSPFLSSLIVKFWFKLHFSSEFSLKSEFKVSVSSIEFNWFCDE